MNYTAPMFQGLSSKWLIHLLLLLLFFVINIIDIHDIIIIITLLLWYLREHSRQICLVHNNLSR